MIKIYGKLGCSSCETAKALCAAKNIEYLYLSLGSDYDLKEFMSYNTAHKSFPLIVKDSEYLGSLTDLKEYLKNL